MDTSSAVELFHQCDEFMIDTKPVTRQTFIGILLNSGYDFELASIKTKSGAFVSMFYGQGVVVYSTTSLESETIELLRAMQTFYTVH